LKDLVDVGDVIVARTAITDKGLTMIAELKSLQSLLLVETKATNAGVKLLADLPELSHLWLEDSTDGKSLNDDALATFKGHRKLFNLTLSGRGFTDASLPHVLAVPQLFELQLRGTSVTTAAIADLKRQRSAIRLTSETAP
jgi:internalin A